jgi:hypothetical protein
MSLKTFEVMPLDVFVGGCGHIVLCQEWTEPGTDETYLRVMIHERDAERICQQIMASARKARGK